MTNAETRAAVTAFVASLAARVALSDPSVVVRQEGVNGASFTPDLSTSYLQVRYLPSGDVPDSAGDRRIHRHLGLMEGVVILPPGSGDAASALLMDLMEEELEEQTAFEVNSGYTQRPMYREAGAAPRWVATWPIYTHRVVQP